MPVSLAESKIYDPYDAYLEKIGSDRFRYNQLYDKIKGLSENLQDFIFDAAPGDFIKDQLAAPFNLNQNQSRETAILVLDIVLANTYLGDIAGEIQKVIGLNQDTSKQIASKIVNELFAPILEDLKKRQAEKFSRSGIGDEVVNLKNNL